MSLRKLAIIVVLAALVVTWFQLGIAEQLELSRLKESLGELQRWRVRNPWLAAAIYFACYILVVALSVPGAAVMTLAGGALFGFSLGLVLVSFASAIGATLAFGIARILFRDLVQQRFGRSLAAINDGFRRDGAFYLFSLRLVPLFPFFIINLVMALLPIGFWRFYWVSQLGMFPATAVYVNAGTQLAEIERPGDVLSPELLLSFVLLALFPLLARALLRAAADRRVLRRWARPKHFDSNLIVIGAGSAGLVATVVARAVRAQVTLIEAARMGGDCLNTGCVPSKTLLRSARMASYARRAGEFGLELPPPRIDFAAVMERVQATIKTIEPHDSEERFRGLGAEVVRGRARIVSPWEVEVDGRRLCSRRIIIASGARAKVPDIPGLAELEPLTSDTLWTLRECPGRLLVLGGGPIGCELAQGLARLGAGVTLVTHGARIMPREDTDAAELVAEALRADGVRIETGWEAERFEAAVDGLGGMAIFRVGGGHETVDFDRVLLAVGRQPNTEDLGLESLGIACDAKGTIMTDEALRTAVPTIYACGDVVGPYQFTHMASHQAWYATINALFGRLRRFRVDYGAVPWTTFTDPEVARVGLSEDEAARQGIAVEVTRYDLAGLDRAIAEGEARGFVKVLTEPGRDRILGATVVGHHAGELIAEFVLAMKHGLGLNKLLGTIHVYPTLSEANRFAASQWRKAHQPERVQALLERWHRWRLG